MPLILDLLVLFILIFINAFFSASEIAIITLNDNMIKKRAEEGDRVSQRLYKLISEPSSFLATIQVGVTLAGFLSSAFAADKFSRRLYDILAVNNRAIYDISLVVVTIILSYFSLVFGELVPKRIAQNNPERMARRVVNIIRATGFVLRPFILLLTASTNLVLKLFGISPNANDRRVTEEEIRMLVDVGRESGSIHANEKEMIEKIFEFNDKEVSEIMTHRTSVVSLDIDSDYAEVLEVAVHEKYTRIPVYEDNIDNIIGILHIKDLLYHAAEGLSRPFSLRHMIRPPYIVPESKTIDALFREMQRDRAQMAVVIDEYGGTAGIVTVEDLLEEIVGSIQDEYDEEEQEIVQKDDNTYLIAGQTSLDEVSEAVNQEFPDEDYDTLAGLVINLLGRIPDEHEYPEVEFGNLRLKVLEMSEKRVSLIELTLLPKAEEGEADD
ncbi:MAG: hemolysin family protein [Saccharofermentanales bacterium]|jgi:putative hemolysin|nr:HlyC/CorC family transporter [Clostridiaceae bacterium]